MLPTFNTLSDNNDNLNLTDNGSPNSQYIAITDLSTKLCNPATISFIHINSRSLWKNHDHISQLLSQCPFDIVAITETWLEPNTPVQMLSIPNYNFINRDRPNKRGGGVGFYIASHINYIIRDDLMHNSNNFESMFVEIISNKSKNTIVGVVYRPPANSIPTFIEDIYILY